MCLWKRKQWECCVSFPAGVFQWDGSTGGVCLSETHLVQPGVQRTTLGELRRDFQRGKLHNDHHIWIIFLVIHLPARTVLDSPVLKNVWMWPWRTWFSGDYLVDCWIWWFPKSLPTLMTPWFGWWAHRPSLVRTSWRDLSLQHFSPKTDFLTPHRDPAWAGQSVRWTNPAFPSTGQPFVCVCVWPACL